MVLRKLRDCYKGRGGGGRVGAGPREPWSSVYGRGGLEGGGELFAARWW